MTAKNKLLWEGEKTGLSISFLPRALVAMVIFYGPVYIVVHPLGFGFMGYGRVRTCEGLEVKYSSHIVLESPT